MLAGAALAVFGSGWIARLTEDFANGIGVTIRKMKFKFTGNLFTIPILNVKVPRSLTIFTSVTIRNSNPVGGKVKSTDLRISYGKGGTYLAPIKSGEFTLSGNSSADVEFTSDLNLVTTPQAVAQVVKQAADGTLKKLWVSGTLNTTFGPVPIDQEVPIFEE